MSKGPEDGVLLAPPGPWTALQLLFGVVVACRRNQTQSASRPLPDSQVRTRIEHGLTRPSKMSTQISFRASFPFSWQKLQKYSRVRYADRQPIFTAEFLQLDDSPENRLLHSL